MKALFTPTLMDRYIFKALMDYFLLGLVVFTLIAFFSDTVLDFIQYLQQYGIAVGTLLTIIGLQLPKAVALVVPACSFLAVLMAYNSLNNHFELISMRMNGVSLTRLIYPALLLGIMSAAITYSLYDFVVPYCNQQTELLRKQALQNSTLPSGRDSFMYKTYDAKHNLMQMIYIANYQGRTLGNSTIIDLTHRGIMQVVQAQSGVWDPATGWQFKNANIYMVSKNKNNSSAGHSGTFWVKGFANANKDKAEEDQSKRASGIGIYSDEQNFWQVFTIMKQREAQGKRVSSKTYIRMWEKITMPLSALVLILSGVALAMTPPRQGSQRGFVFSIGVLAVYYTIRSVSVALGRSGFFTMGGLITMPYAQMLAAWLPIIIMATIGLLLLRRKTFVL